MTTSTAAHKKYPHFLWRTSLSKITNIIREHIHTWECKRRNRQLIPIQYLHPARMIQIFNLILLIYTNGMHLSLWNANIIYFLRCKKQCCCYSLKNLQKMFSKIGPKSFINAYHAFPSMTWLIIQPTPKEPSAEISLYAN